MKQAPLASREHVQRLLRLAGEQARSPWVAFPAIALLQLKVLWAAWIYRDLTQGDTASYFQRAFLWHQDGKVDVIWSPLYTAFYGWVYGITGDVYAATVLHRVLIVLLVSLLVLALFRRFFSPGIAWMAAVWWAVIPFNFDVFEVHVFAILPLVAAPLAVLVWPEPRGRGIALGILLAATFLVRNEMSVVFFLTALLFLVWEKWLAPRREPAAPYPIRTYALGYGVPLAVSAIVVLFFFGRSVVPLSKLSEEYGPKHTVNMCQAYSFGYKQRHPEWTKDHWTECSELMQEKFGEPLPTLWTMIRRNPKAVAGHFAWNFLLLPSGVQLSLFGSMSGRVTPDYQPVPMRRFLPITGSVAVALLTALGLTFRYRGSPTDRTRENGDALLGWLALLPAAVVVVGLIVPTQRPRPEYLYGLSLPIVGVAAWGASALVRRWGLSRVAALTPLLMLFAFVVCGTYYVPPTAAVPVRPLLDAFRRLETYQYRISAPGTVFLAGEHSFSLGHYLVRPRVEPPPRVLGKETLSRLGGTETVGEFLGRFGIDLLYLDESVCRELQANPLHREFLQGVGTNGWISMASGRTGNDPWSLIAKAPATGSATPRSTAYSPIPIGSE